MVTVSHQNPRAEKPLENDALTDLYFKQLIHLIYVKLPSKSTIYDNIFLLFGRSSKQF